MLASERMASGQEWLLSLLQVTSLYWLIFYSCASVGTPLHSCALQVCGPFLSQFSFHPPFPIHPSSSSSSSFPFLLLIHPHTTQRAWIHLFLSTLPLPSFPPFFLSLHSSRSFLSLSSAHQTSWITSLKTSLGTPCGTSRTSWRRCTLPHHVLSSAHYRHTPL